MSENLQVPSTQEKVSSHAPAKDAGGGGGLGSSPPPPFQLKANPPATPNSGGDGSDSGGDGNVMSKMEGAFGQDFSNVNIHKGSDKASSMGALAYTQGNDVHFAPGQFNPESKSGQELLGHELTHVVQQREGRVQPNTSINGNPVNNDKGLETEADVMGAKAAQAKLDTPPAQKKSAKNGSSNGAPMQGKFDPQEAGKNGPGGEQGKVEPPQQQPEAEEKEESETEEKQEAQNTNLVQGDPNAVEEGNEEEESTVESENELAPELEGNEEKEGEEEQPKAKEEKEGEKEGEEDAEKKGEKEGEGEGKGEAGAEGKAGPEGKGGAEGEGGKGGGDAKGGGAPGGENAGGGGGGENAGGNAGGGGPVGGENMAPPQMGNFGEGQEPQLFIANQEAASGISGENILQDNGDGSFVVQNQTPNVSPDALTSDAPIQMQNGGDKDPPAVAPIPKEQTDPAFVKNRNEVQAHLGTFQSGSEAEVKKIDDLNKAIPGKVNGAATLAKGKVLGHQMLQTLRIEGGYLLEKGKLLTESLRIQGEASKALTDKKDSITKKAEAARLKADTAYTTQLGELTTLETTMLGKVNSAFTDAKQDMIDVATAAGKRAKKKGNARASQYAGMHIPSMSRSARIFKGGSFEKDRHDARVKAAKDTGNGFAAEFMKVAKAEGEKLKSAGQAELQKYVKDSVIAAKANILARKKAAHTKINGIEKAAKKAAQDAYDAKHKAGLKIFSDANAELTRQKGLQLGNLRTTSQAQITAIDGSAKQLISALQKSAGKASAGFKKKINETVTQISNMPNPASAAIKTKLDGIQSGMTTSVGEVVTQLNSGVTSGGTSLNGIATKAGEALALIGDGAIAMANGIQTGAIGQIDALKTSFIDTDLTNLDPMIEEIVKEGGQAETDIKAEHTATKKGLDEVHGKLTTKFAENTKGLKTDFDKQVNGLDAEITKQATKAYNAVQPRWKSWLLFIVDLAIAIIVTAVICAALASGGILVALAVGVVAGAIGGALKYGAKVALGAEEFSWGALGKEMALGAVSGVITALGAGAGGAAGKWLVGKVASGSITAFGSVAASYIGEVGVGFVVDTVGTGITEVLKHRMETGEWDLSKFGEAFTLRNLSINFLGNLGGKYVGDKLGAWLKGSKGVVSETAETGVKNTLEETAKNTLEESAKNTVEETAKNTIEESAKNTVEETAKNTIEESAKNTVEESAKETVENTVEETAKETVENTTEQTAKETVENTTEQTAKETVENTTEETAKETVENTTEETAKETVENTTEETAKETVENTTEETAKETVENTTEETAKETVENTTEETAKETVENTTEETAKETVENTTEETAKETVENTTEETAKETVENTSEQTAKETTEETAKETAETTAEQAAKGAQLAKSKGYPDAPDGYHWADYDGTPVLRRNPGKAAELPPVKINPSTKKFDVDVAPPKGYHWSYRNGKFTIDRNPNMKDTLPKLDYDPKTGGFKEAGSGNAFNPDITATPARGTSYGTFKSSAGLPDGPLAQKAFELWKLKKWGELEALINKEGLNGGWPPNRGFTDVTEKTLPPGTIFDRFGGRGSGDGFSDTGKFVAPKDVPFENRALPDATKSKPYKVYEIVSPIKADSGGAIPWFGQPGKGIQWELKESINDLLAAGKIRLVE